MSTQHTNAPLRRTRGDLIATGVIALVCAIALIWAYFSAPIRQAELTPATEEVPHQGELAVVPATLTESWRVTDESPRKRPLVVNGLIITYADHTITARKADKTEVWSYKRTDAELCGLTSLSNDPADKVVAIYRSPAGCGDVVAINSATGQYDRTRSAPAPDEVVTINSNDRVGTVASTRTELWRDDLVRTVEYGEVEAPQEGDMQPHPECEITSAMTRKELLALTEKCEDGTYLRFQDTTPEDPRKPEMRKESVKIPDGSYLVAIEVDAAAIYDPAESVVSSYSQDGSALATTSVPQSNLLADAPHGVANPETADLPENMSFYDGSNLMLLEPGTLQVTMLFEGTALGTGVAIDGKLLFPSEDGITVANWRTQESESAIAVDRGGYTGPVSIASAGPTIVEKRGSDIVVLDATV